MPNGHGLDFRLRRVHCPNLAVGQDDVGHHRRVIRDRLKTGSEKETAQNERPDSYRLVHVTKPHYDNQKPSPENESTESFLAGHGAVSALACGMEQENDTI